MNQKTAPKKVALGLSGGVDSAVSAYLLKKQGYDITAVYLECWHTPGCRAEQDRKDALEVALQLNIPFKSLDFSKEYKEKVMSYFLKEYKTGRTPNPDVLCNQVIKFGMFYDWALNNGYDAIATGHYAQISQGPERKKLLTSKDLHKDQTYFLHQIVQKQLEHVIFPVGHLLKEEVRTTAKEASLAVADKKDSVGICFVGDINVAEFLKEELGENPGEVVTAQGDVIGKHSGLWFYTIGQGKGFSIDKKAIEQNTNWTDKQGDIPPLYVIDKKQQQNQLVIGPKIETTQTKWEIHSLHRIDPDLNWENIKLNAKIRHTGKIIPCDLTKIQENLWQVTTTEPVQGVASGQFTVFYQENSEPELKSRAKYTCLGGGVIR